MKWIHRLRLSGFAKRILGRIIGWRKHFIKLVSNWEYSSGFACIVSGDSRIIFNRTQLHSAPPIADCHPEYSNWNANGKRNINITSHSFCLIIENRTMQQRRWTKTRRKSLECCVSFWTISKINGTKFIPFILITQHTVRFGCWNKRRIIRNLRWKLFSMEKTPPFLFNFICIQWRGETKWISTLIGNLISASIAAG